MAQFTFTRRVDPHDVSLTIQLEDADFEKLYPPGSTDPNDECFALFGPQMEPSKLKLVDIPALGRLMSALLERAVGPAPPAPTAESVDALTSRLKGSSDGLASQ